MGMVIASSTLHVNVTTLQGHTATLSANVLVGDVYSNLRATNHDKSFFLAGACR